MQTNILWKGREYHSLENCLVNTTNSSAEINSTIIGSYNGQIYKVEYNIKTNHNWELASLQLHSQHSNRRDQIRFESDGTGNWTYNGRPVALFKGCSEIDISLSPFTNTLPINRLKLSTGEERQISVLYIDILGQQVRPVQQKYTRLSDTKYRYENVPNDFEAEIVVDELGFVVDYPGLFLRTILLKTAYK